MTLWETIFEKNFTLRSTLGGENSKTSKRPANIDRFSYWARAVIRICSEIKKILINVIAYKTEDDSLDEFQSPLNTKAENKEEETIDNENEGVEDEEENGDDDEDDEDEVNDELEPNELSDGELLTGE